ncbi:TAXI family TRAP transporter solute-binding subunit [Halomonas kalidii]|uniref:TAXI family TRAP transporter solute-binding subunit n=1 Tax=Halomonas kalidii TaxID=3043293 RepID=A0ABT6VNA2_9GAMM|nr:TAXI family TRAP transporter solute-binding subunit [Halomonas kalidii]MDI5934984.1 TAXI family TRAP transporter solute-binding subunit [Halomonas kalidii]
MIKVLKPLTMTLIGGALLSGALGLISSDESLAQSNYRLKTLGTGSSPYVVSTVFSDIVNNHSDYSIQVDATGSGPEHAVATAQGATQFTSSFSPGIAALMKSGSGMFETLPQSSELYDNMRTIFNYPMGLYHAAVYADSGIETYADLEGKRVFTGPKTGQARKTVEPLIEAITGYKAGEDYEVINISWDAAAQSFQDGNIDVYFNPTQAPSPILTQIAMSNDIRFLSIPDMEKGELAEVLNRPGYRVVELPVGMYGDNQVNTEPARSIGVTIGMATNRDMPEEAIYTMTKTFWENLEEKQEAIPQMRNLSLDTVFQDMNTPLHPGALRYYQEVGLDIPNDLVPSELK